MQCSGPSAPRILKQCGVQINFILDVVGCWGDVYIRFIFYAVLGTFRPSHFEMEWCLDSIYLICSAQDLLPLLSEIVVCWGVQITFILQCSGPSAPRILKQWGVYTVQNIFISDIVLGSSSPLHSEMVECSGCWGVQISFIYMQCSGPLAPFFLKQWLFKLSSDIFECFKFLSFV